VPGYGEDLAHIHGQGFSELAELAAASILEVLGRSGIGSGLVVELGCGTGRTARRLVDVGFDVLGVDASQAMIAAAHEAVPEAEFVVRSFVDVDLPPCRAVIAVGEVLGYLLDPANTGAVLAEFVARVHRALEPGGLLVFDLAGPGRVAGPGPQRSWAAGDDWAVLVEAEEDREARRLTRSITTFRRQGEGYRRGAEVHRLRLHCVAEVLALLRGAGFRARVLRGYSGEPFAPGHRVYVGRARR